MATLIVGATTNVLLGRYAAFAAVVGGLAFLVGGNALLRQFVGGKLIRRRQDRLGVPQDSPSMPPDPRVGFSSFLGTEARAWFVIGLIAELTALVLVVVWLLS